MDGERGKEEEKRDDNHTNKMYLSCKQKSAERFKRKKKKEKHKLQND